MVSEDVPVAALLFAEIVNLDDPEAPAGFGLNEALTPNGSLEMLSVTELLEPIAVRVTVSELLDLRTTVIVEGAVMEKSPAGGFTVTDSDVVWVRVPSVPLMVNE